MELIFYQLSHDYIVVGLLATHSVSIATKVCDIDSARGEVYSIQPYVISFGKLVITVDVCYKSDGVVVIVW
jgi:hypothetical protein